METADDPTLAFLNRLADLRQFEVKRGVPIWVPHRRVVANPDGTSRTVEVTEADLPAYADFINRIEAERGVVGRITDGHVKPGAPQREQPALLGFYRTARVGRFGPRGVPAVLVDCYYDRTKLGVVRERPYRSPEVYPAAKEIRGLALLLTDPYLDMGTVTYESTTRPTCYGAEHMPDADATNDTTAPGESVAADEARQFEKFLHYVRAKYGLGAMWPGADAETGNANETATDAGAIPTTTGSLVPMESDRTLEHYEEQLGAMQARLDGLLLQQDQERCQQLLTSGLVGHNLAPEERQKEFARLARLPAADRADRIAELRLIYADRKPPEGQFVLYRGPVEGGEAARNNPHTVPWYHDVAMQYMRDNPGVMYDAAVEKAIESRS